ncbi:uncharacterized protein B0I36DRAFT_328162 [Microdochium trichocladiopsis]|uniref:Beta-glucuronidase C-terminal domain-containing protein n=1 Tax=Microdochium trichocladiopsis TaxID=1682393 RepID=A0A9P9BS30_9PEZI|nr:uncharacterized protein B0I36DRAFT_328162 [Microdochium trichocladiopsis]KAH7027895.1 hypothetical protein B0I36DRAFT_328162 [Microdochium trichocladiopsis]
MHLYPQSTCDPARWHRMRLDLLSNHTALWLNVSQYAPQVAAADVTGHPFVMGETNSVSCGGRSGISDTFGAALWGVDYVLTAASVGIEKIYFHLGGNSEYSSFTPLGYPYKNETLEAGIRPGWYAHYFLAHVVRPLVRGGGAGAGERFEIAGLPSANSSSLSGFAVYGTPPIASLNSTKPGGGSTTAPRTRRATEQQQQPAGDAKTLRKLVLLDMGVWNGTAGLSNPSTLSVTDGTAFSPGSRPSSTFRVATPWCPGRNASVVRLQAPGTNAKSEVSVSGVTFDPLTGDVQASASASAGGGGLESEVVSVGEKGVVEIEVVRAQGVLLEMNDVSPCGGTSPGGGGGGGNGGTGAGTGAAGRNGPMAATWLLAVVMCAVGTFML